MAAYDHKNPEKWMLLLFPLITMALAFGVIALISLAVTFLL